MLSFNSYGQKPAFGFLILMLLLELEDRLCGGWLSATASLTLPAADDWDRSALSRTRPFLRNHVEER